MLIIVDDREHDLMKSFSVILNNKTNSSTTFQNSKRDITYR